MGAMPHVTLQEVSTMPFFWASVAHRHCTASDISICSRSYLKSMGPTKDRKEVRRKALTGRLLVQEQARKMRTDLDLFRKGGAERWEEVCIVGLGGWRAWDDQTS